MTHEDACNILDIPFEADLKAAQKAWWKLAKERHPDKGGDSLKFRLTKDAWECLKKTIPERQAQKKEERGHKTEEHRRKAEEERQRKAEEERQRKATEEAKRKAEEERQRKAEEERQRKAAEEARRKAEEERQRKAAEEARRKAEEERQRKAAEELKRAKDLAALRKWGTRVAIVAAIIGIGFLIGDISGMFGNNDAIITATAPSPRLRAFPTPPLTKEIERNAIPNRVKNQLMDKEEIGLLPVVPTVSPSNLGLDDPSMPPPSMSVIKRSQDDRQPPPSLPRRSLADSPLEEKKPPLNADRPLTESEVRYCVFQKERLTHLRAMATTVLLYQQFSHMHRKIWMGYKALAMDYGVRCVNTRYSPDPEIVKKVEAEAALNRAKLRSEADQIFVRWQNLP